MTHFSECIPVVKRRISLMIQGKGNRSVPRINLTNDHFDSHKFERTAKRLISDFPAHLDIIGITTYTILTPARSKWQV